MELKEAMMEPVDVSSTWNSPPQIQSPEPSSRFIRLKTTYWNTGYAIVLLAFIGLIIQDFQLAFSTKIIMSKTKMNTTLLELHDGIPDFVKYYRYGFCIGLIPGGVLATIFPADKILGISVIISSICHILTQFTGHSKYDFYSFLQFCTGTSMATAYTSIFNIWTYWVPLNKHTLGHFPLILCLIIKLNIKQFSCNIFYNYILNSTVERVTLFGTSLGIIGLVWYVLWFYVINGDRLWSIIDCFKTSQTSSGTSAVPRVTRSTISDIPWNSFCTSKPVIAITLSYMCDAIYTVLKNYVFQHYVLFYHWFYYIPVPNQSYLILSIYSIILLFLFIELVQETTVNNFSSTNVRKFWSCTYFVSMSIVFFLKNFSLKKANEMWIFILTEVEYLSYFGFKINHLDIAPKYASVLYGFLMTIYHISVYLLEFINIQLFNARISNHYIGCFLMAIICVMVTVFYAIFGSVEPQPWAVDKSVPENRRNHARNSQSTGCATD